MESEHGHHKHLRFYVVLITLVIGAIFFLLLLNNNSKGEGFSLTSAVIGDKKDIEENLIASDNGEEGTPVSKIFTNKKSYVDAEKALSQELEKSPKDIDLKLTLDQAPDLQQKVKVKELLIKFSDLNTRIQVNGDTLDLSNLESVSLKVVGFTGNVNLNNIDFSLEGKAKVIEVNDMSLTAKGEIDLSIEGLNYKVVTIEDVAVDNILQFENGQGKLDLGEKLSYNLEEELLKVYYFQGRIVVDKENGMKTELEGVTKGVTGQGALLNFNVK